MSCVHAVDVFVRRAGPGAGCSAEADLLHAAIAVLTQTKPRDSADLHPASHDIPRPCVLANARHVRTMATTSTFRGCGDSASQFVGMKPNASKNIKVSKSKAAAPRN